MKLALTIILTLFSIANVIADDLNIMTYNIRTGLGPGRDVGRLDPAKNLQAIAAVIAEQGAEIVLLQEVDKVVERTGGLDVAAELGDLLGMNSFHSPAIDLQGGTYGTAILTSWEIRDQMLIPLYRPDHAAMELDLPGYFAEQRIATLSTLTSGENEIKVINLHLGLTREQRLRQIDEVCEIVKGLGDTPVILGGDLNCTPDAPELAPIRMMLRDCYQDFIDERGIRVDIPVAERLTFHALEPKSCIDYLFVSKDFEVHSTEVIETTASDHFPVVSHLTLR